MEHQTSHTSPGFGKNTNGFGIAIIAIVLVSFALVAWGLWNHGDTQAQWYRYEKKSSTGHGKAEASGHGHDAAEKKKH
ncbi:MAG TPA: hypothetical protein VLC98_13415 [Phnomibacter sp.]|nr:hypothetical protein [Phnomibacter sp.]